jgi:hypothetical protein
MNLKKPFFIDFTKRGEPSLGYISIANLQPEGFPFEVKRVFWTYYTPESIIRGRHAHYDTEQLLVAIAGRIIVTTESAGGLIETWVLDNPNIGLYLPPNYWHTMQYSHSAVQLAFASSLYDERDYIRRYEDFKAYYNESA